MMRPFEGIPNPSMDDEWYYTENDTAIGPLDLSELKAALRVRQGNLNRILIWRSDFASWKKISDVPELKAVGLKPPPVPKIAVSPIERDEAQQAAPRDERGHQRQNEQQDTSATPPQSDERTGEKKSFGLIIGKIALSIVAYCVIAVVAGVTSEIIFGRAFAVNPLLSALLVPTLVAIWFRTSMTRRISAILVGGIVGAGLWALLASYAFSSSASAGSVLFLGLYLTSSAVISGTLAYFICQTK
jgi:GYF domain 2